MAGRALASRMVDKLTPAGRSANMAKIRSRDTAPERAVRRALYAAGYRYRLNGKSLPGNPDIFFVGRKKAIFVHGCFWHQHESAACTDGHRPKSNTGYWDAKLLRNVERDQENTRSLAACGWSVLIIWECELQRDPNISDKLREFIGPVVQARRTTSSVRLQPKVSLAAGGKLDVSLERGG